MLIGLLLAGACQRTAEGSTKIQIGTEVLRHSVQRLGINLGSASFYDGSQMMSNLVFRNPGFEGELYRSVLRCTGDSGAGECTAENSGSSDWPNDFWKSAEFEFISGASKGRGGTIARSTTAHDAVNIVFAQEVPHASGDYVVLRKEFPGDAAAGWWPRTCCGGSISSEMYDLPHGTAGRQAIRISSLAGGEAELSSYFGSSQGRSFIELRGRYRLTFKAKAAGAGERTLQVAVSRNGNPTEKLLSETVKLAPEWKTYTLRFEANETGTAYGMAQLRFNALRSDVLLDDVSLSPDVANPKNPTAFLDGVVKTLEDLKPGFIRYWGGQLGDSLDNQLAPAFGRRRSGYSIWKNRQEDIGIGLNEFLELCEHVGAEPWYVVPITFSEEEMRRLVEFLSARAPDALRKIHLEFGNEAWNATFRGGTIEDPNAYGRRANELFLAARSTPGFSPEQFDLVVGGQAVNADRNRLIAEAAPAADTVAVASYQMRRVDSYASTEDLFQPLLLEPQAVTGESGFMGQNAAMLRRLSKRKDLAIYEVNVDSMAGSINQEALDSLIPSLGTGIAVIENMLLSLRDLGVSRQMFWNLGQYSTRRSDGKNVRLYGAVVDTSASGLRRPQFLALQLANDALVGDMLATRQSGADPIIREPGRNGVAPGAYHAIESFAFSSGNQRSLILLNVSVTGALDVQFAGPNAPRGSVQVERLASGDIRVNDEVAQNLSIERTSIASFDPSSDFLLPPHSMTVLRWQQP